MPMSLEELKKIRDKMQNTVNMRDGGGDKIRVLVGMATCGIASGARPVLRAFSDMVQEEELSDKIMVSQIGCIGLCQYEPIVEVLEEGKPKVTYVEMTPEKAREVMDKHLKGGEPIREYTISSAGLKR